MKFLENIYNQYKQEKLEEQIDIGKKIFLSLDIVNEVWDVISEQMCYVDSDIELLLERTSLGFNICLFRLDKSLEIGSVSVKVNSVGLIKVECSGRLSTCFTAEQVMDSISEQLLIILKQNL